MNIANGLTRAWLVASVVWVIYCAWQSDVACPLVLVGLDVPNGPWCEFQNAEPLRYYGGLALKMVAPPIAAWLMGAAANWILVGFRRPSRSN